MRPFLMLAWRALLEYAIASASASALAVVRVAGIESEMELAFAGLHQRGEREVSLGWRV
jgi:hypothetical protein